MKNSNLSLRIKELRTQSGCSQAELADNAKLSLRTIQRIENGETTPRGDTLKRLSSALNISSDELIILEEQSDKLFLVLLNLSALSFIVFPLLGVIVPLILWVVKKDKLKNLDDIARVVLNFQIMSCLLFLLIFTLTMVTKIWHVGFRLPIVNINSFDLLFMLYLGLYVYNVLLIVINAIRTQYEKPVNYFPAIKFIK